MKPKPSASVVRALAALMLPLELLGACKKRVPEELAGAASEPAAAVRQLAAHLQRNDLEGFARDAVPPATHARLDAAWRAGDVERLRDDMAAEMKREYPALYRRINSQRNEAWLPKLEARLAGRSDDTLVVVGALHLLGEDGVVEKLRARGYAVERICSACAAAK